MTTVRTRQLAAQNGLTAPAVVYTVPSGEVAVIECVSWTYGNNLGPSMFAFLETELTLCKFAAINVQGVTVDFTSQTVLGKWVLNETDVVAADVSGWTVDLLVSGYTLTLP